jgi:DNA-binding CsgD family transcriptional regulator
LAELDRVGRVERVELPRLDRAETIAQLTAILEAAPASDLVEAVFARSEGNPFFTEELLASIRAGAGELPVTVRDLLRGRVDVLPEPARRVLAAAAVAGRQVPHRLLAAVASLDLDDEQLSGALRAAVAHQLLVVRTGQDDYELRHALLGEIVEADLLPGERASLHARYAKVLAERPELAPASPTVAAAELAAHWDAAGVPARALAARVAAGLAAERAHAFAEADRHYQRALQLWGQVPDPGRPAGFDLIDLLARAAEAAARTGTTDRAIVLLEQALDRVDPAAEPMRAAVLLRRLGEHHHTAANHSAALAAYAEAERLLAAAAPSAERANVLAEHAHALWASGRRQEAIPRLEEAIAVARLAGARAEEALALNSLASCLDDPDELDRSIALHLDARRLAEEAGDAETVIDTYVALCATLLRACRDQQALANAQEGYQRARQLGLERAMGSYVAHHLAWQLLAAGRWEECERLTGELLAGDSWDAGRLHAIRGQLLARRGDFAAAWEQLDRALRLSSPFDRGEARVGLVEFALWEGRHDNADTAVAEAQHWYAEHYREDTDLLVYTLLYVLTLRVEADRAERAAARRAPEEVAVARRRAAAVLAEFEQVARKHRTTNPNVASSLLLAQAELSRLEGPSDPERWQAAANAWERLERPFDAAYARFRQAEALLASGTPRPEAEEVLRSAHHTAVALGAEPLRREIQLLAQRGRLQLKEKAESAAAPEAPTSPTASLGLTRREIEVLALVAQGRSNRQIGGELFITEKTASVHVSNILAKLGVASRVEAAAIAHRLGLDKR